MVNGVLRAAVIAGVIAGGAAAGFHWFLTEPAVDRAIEIEQQSEKAEGKPVEEPVVSRPTQRLGLILGFLLYGLAWGLLSGICFYLVRSWLPPWSERTPAIFLVVLLGWSVAIFPFLKYPANPPGVGDPETIGYRQGLYLGCIALSVIGTALFFRLQSLPRFRKEWTWPVLGYVLFLAVVYFALPGNPDPVNMSSDVVWRFRALSLTGLILFWSLLAGVFQWVLAHKQTSITAPRG